MNSPLNDCEYDKIKILHELSAIVWFIKKHALTDAQQDTPYVQLLKAIEHDLEKHIRALKNFTCK